MKKTITSLQPGKQYSIQFRTVGVSDVSEWSQVLNFQTSTDLVAPAKVTNLKGSLVERSFVISWDAPTKNTNGTDLTDFKDYKITITADGVSRTFYTSETIYNFVYDQNVASFGQAKPNLKFSVSARDNSLNSNPDEATVILSNSFPIAASGLTALSVTDAINFTWTSSSDTDVAKYRIYKGGTATTTSEKIYEGPVNQFFYATKDYTTRFFKLSTVDYFNQETFTSGSITAAAGRAGTDTTPPVDPSWSANWYSIETDLSNPYTLKKNVVLTWVANTVDTDFSHYIISYRKVGTGAFSQMVSYSNSVRINDMAPNTFYEMSVANVDRAGNRSNFIPAPETLNTGQDTGAPAKPSTPTTENYVGQMVVVWNGRTSTGGNMPSDFSHANIYASKTAAFTPSTTNYVGRINASNSQQRIIVGGLDFEVTYYIKIIAYDFSGNASVASDEVSGSAKRINGTDIQDASINSAKISELSAGKITTGELSSTTSIIAGPVVDTHAELTGTGLRVFGKSPDVIDEAGNIISSGTIHEVIRLGTSSSDYFGVISGDGDLLAGIDDTGSATFQNLSTTSLNINGDSFDSIMDSRGGQLVGRYWRTGQSRPKIYQVERGLIEFYAPMKAGKEYTISGDFQIYQETLGKHFFVYLKSNLDEASPTTSSRTLAQRAYTPVSTTPEIVHVNIRGRFRAPKDGVARILASASCAGGQLTLDPRPCLFDIVEEGYIPNINMGGSSDGAWTDPNGGGTTTPVPPPTTEEPNPEPILVNYTKQYQALWSGAYNSKLERRPYVDVYQGKRRDDTSNDGNRRSMIGFSDQIVNDLAGATINSMRVFLYRSGGYLSGNAEVRIGLHNAINRPEVLDATKVTWYTERVGKYYFGKGQGRWINIPQEWWNGFKTGTHRGIYIGAAVNDHYNYDVQISGAGKTQGPILEIKYTK